MKFKLEPNILVTPYFVSLDSSGAEKIHFITNKYSTYTEPDDYKTIVQVPIYSDTDQYYETPVYNEGTIGGKSNYDYVNTHINNLSPEYTKAELDNYPSMATFPISSTLIDKSDAYQKYSYRYNIEIIDDSTFESLP